MRNQKTSKRILIFLFIAALIFIPGRFAWGSLDVLNTRADDIQSQADRLNEQAQKAQSEVIDDADGFAARAARADAAIPPSMSIPTVIDQLSQEASAAGLVWLSGSPNEIPAPEGLGAATSLAVSLTSVDGLGGQGFVSSVENFLTRLRDLDRLVVVDRVSISPQDGTASVQLRFFSQDVN